MWISDAKGRRRPIKETDMIIDDVRDNVDAVLFKEYLFKCMDKLNERQKLVLELRFWKGMTLQSIGNILSVCREVVRQIESKALRILYRNIKKYFSISETKETIELSRKKKKQIY